MDFALILRKLRYVFHGPHTPSRVGISPTTIRSGRVILAPCSHPWLWPGIGCLLGKHGLGEGQRQRVTVIR